MKRSLVVLLTIVFVMTIAIAHGNEQHVIGTVTAIESNSITVKTTAGKLVTVQLDSKTQFTKGNATAALADLKVGDKGVIHAKKDHDKLVAHTVKFGAMQTGDTSAGHQHGSH